MYPGSVPFFSSFFAVHGVITQSLTFNILAFVGVINQRRTFHVFNIC